MTLTETDRHRQTERDKRDRHRQTAQLPRSLFTSVCTPMPTQPPPSVTLFLRRISVSRSVNSSLRLCTLVASSCRLVGVVLGRGVIFAPPLMRAASDDTALASEPSSPSPASPSSSFGNGRTDEERTLARASYGPYI